MRVDLAVTAGALLADKVNRVAFVAMHATAPRKRGDKDYLYYSKLRRHLARTFNRRFPPLVEHGGRLRFFYFNDYEGRSELDAFPESGVPSGARPARTQCFSSFRWI